ncbi:hypothetical protein OG689_42035 [Kitasatospora sp. NBC_00240]|uniref:hypothetical protein n=1 Tax=Kitasatospora sp. NBC_00240 TaxID=2903567 RepID=UPI00225BD7E4|nr:hypothetical protein [Kitasatospora sp. NBC_00240]MCX5215738.1 hypothetical protein [Kitasatospora sp. NBC_00240]
MPKNQTTAAQAARQDTNDGTKYTTALRARQAAASKRAPVLRFLAQQSGHLYELVGGITAAWARTGLRVLLLEEADDAWRYNVAARGRRRRLEPVTAPEPVTTVLWEQPAGAGTLVHQTCLWELRGPGSDRGLPQRDRTPVREAAAAARQAHDVVVLLPHRGWAYPDRELATTSVVLAEVDEFPHTDCRVAVPGTDEERGAPLTPEQCAAVLRERYLSFIFGFPLPPITLDGLIWLAHGELPVDGAYLGRVDRDMERAGLRPLGWATSARLPLRYRQLPSPEQLSGADFVLPYREIAARLRQVLGSLPA